MSENYAKERLIDVTIRMICQGKTPSEITVKDITETAELGNGMVNQDSSFFIMFFSKKIRKLMRILVKKREKKRKQPLQNKNSTKKYWKLHCYYSKIILMI